MPKAPTRCRRCHQPGQPIYCQQHAPCQINVIAGPPGAGKTTYVRQHAEHGDLIWDWDHVMAAISNTDVHTHHETLLPYVAEARDAILSMLRRQLPRAPERAWIITSDATHQERTRWSPWPVHTIDTPLDVCLTRLEGRNPSTLAAARDWWDRHEPA